MTQSEQLELGIFRLADAYDKGRWKPTCVSTLASALQFSEWGVLVDAIDDLHARQVLEIRKWDATRNGWLMYDGHDKDEYLYRDFYFRVSFAGRRYFERLQAQAAEESRLDRMPVATLLAAAEHQAFPRTEGSTFRLSEAPRTRAHGRRPALRGGAGMHGQTDRRKRRRHTWRRAQGAEVEFPAARGFHLADFSERQFFTAPRFISRYFGLFVSYAEFWHSITEVSLRAMPQKALVCLHPSVLDLDPVLMALLWVDNFKKVNKTGESDDEFRKRLAELGYVVIHAAHYDPAGIFGPILTVEGMRGNKKNSLEIVVPWSKVLAVVHDKTGKFEPGFRQVR
jgi:hypothetical protein